ncbi:GNAT family N-acetyltransferase [Methylocella sp.]|uniref:GNAT family N-acetyltransferase n=1 Tax=Methylocella sp. TaxID=1978226 RepID=UPI0035AE0AA7
MSEGASRTLGGSMSQSMRRLFARAPAYRPLPAARAGECARLHATGFSFPWSEEDFEQLLTDASVVADGAFDADDALCGMILSRTAADEAEILTIAVAPERRRAGVGAALLRVQTPRLVARGAERLFLEVDSGNLAARALYAARGFRKVGERKAYYRKGDAPPASALLLRLDFNP